jgi:biopolymer transport protein ExbD
MTMVRLSRPEPERVGLNLSPLIDVVFILLIFVLLVARFVEQERLDVDLPDAKALAAAPSDDTLTVVIAPDGSLRVGARPVDADSLEAVLETLRPRYRRLLIAGDERSALQHSIRVLTAAQAAGFNDTSFAVEDRAPGEKPAGD